MGYIVLDKLEFEGPQSRSIYVYVDWKLCSLPNTSENWTLGDSHLVDATGMFSPAVIIEDLESFTCYDIRVTNITCGFLETIDQIFTGETTTTTTAELPPSVAMRALIGTFDIYQRYCDFQGFPDTFYRSDPFDPFDPYVYSDSSLTTIAPKGLYIDPDGTAVRYWEGSQYNSTLTMLPGGSTSSFIYFDYPSSGSSMSYGYIQAGQTMRFTFKITKITGTPPLQWRLGGTNAVNNFPLILFSSYGSCVVGEELSLEIPYTVCDVAKVEPQVSPYPISSDPAFSIDFTVNVELI